MPSGSAGPVVTPSKPSPLTVITTFVDTSGDCWTLTDVLKPKNLTELRRQLIHNATRAGNHAADYLEAREKK